MNNSTDELAIAYDVTTQHTRFWFRIARQVVITIVLYALFAAIMSVSRWLASTGSKPSPEPELALTLTPEAGMGVMAVLATIVIALNVSVWAGHSTEVSAAVAHTRRRYLATCGMLTGSLAVLTGLAVVFNNAPGKVTIASLLLLAGALVLAVVGSDASPLLGKDIPVQRRVPEVEQQMRIRALTAVGARWRDPNRALRTHLTLWTVLDIVSISITATLPLLAFWLYRAVVDDRPVDWWHALAATAGAALFATFLAIYTIYGTVRHFVARHFTNALMTCLFGSLTYAIAALSLILADAASLAIVIAVTFVVPPLLIGFALVTGVWRGVPGWTVKANVYRSIVRDLANVRSRRSNAPTVTRGSRLVARTREWIDRVTGMTGLRDHAVQDEHPQRRVSDIADRRRADHGGDASRPSA